MNFVNSMASTEQLEEQLKKLARELSGYKIELHQTRGYLQCILQNSNDMIFATDVDGILVSFSKGGEKVLGYRWEEVAGSFVKQFAMVPEEFEELIRKSQEEGSAVRLELPFRHKDGHTVYCDVSLITLTNTKGQKVGVVGVCRDITSWKQLQEDLIRVDRLAEIGRIAAGIAHEINNPLAVISEIAGWAKVVVEDAKDLNKEDKEELTKAVSDIIEQTKRCRAITHQLLGFSRDSAPEKTRINLDEFIKQTVTFLQPELKYKDIEIVYDFEKSPIHVTTDPKMLEQVLVNLVTNAIHAIADKPDGKGRIELRTREEDGYVELAVSDNGPGIKEEDREKIFNLFFTTKPPGIGTGLGLPICQNIMKKLGGKITFETEVGTGTTFRILIPSD
ncbi:MAG: hypothetical protein DRH12_07390 [Deltaproteobacteria bacterium]|nr:MAG: hypothetical protein DRH12_07390 [Deltaproteobacteria bacterium]RLB76742.1 MAG: hypothetical protein DRH15_12225 [Deltaproteobacteria bacterium]